MKFLPRAFFAVSIFFAVSTNAIAESVAYQLAVVNKGSYVSQDHITVKRFDSLLKQLTSTYVEDEKQIGNMTVTVIKTLRDSHGIISSYLNIMEGINTLYISSHDYRYRHMLAMYSTFRVSSYSHDRALTSLQQLINSGEFDKIINQYG